MATEEQKKENLVRMYKLVIEGLTKGLYDLFGESSYAVMHTVGDDMLDIMQKEMGLEIGGESVHEELAEVARLFVDEFGFVDKIVIDEEDEHHAKVHTENCHAHNLCRAIEDTGIEHPFVCPIMNVMSAAIRKNLGKHPHEQVDHKHDAKGSTITLKWED